MANTETDLHPWREHWPEGSTPLFEYHCYEGHDSADAQLWYRSHQRVVVLGEGDHDGGGLTYAERLECGAPKVYRVRFADGFEGDVLDDELMENATGFSRPAPPCGI